MRHITTLAAGFLVCACTTAVPTGEWPDTAYRRTELEQVSLKGRLVMVEQVPRFLAAGGSGAPRLNADASFDQYIFWDLCRGEGVPWQMVTLRPDAKARSGWGYTYTRIEPATETRSGETIIREGRLRRTVAGYEDLKTAGLSFFKAGEFTCNSPSDDPGAGAAA